MKNQLKKIFMILFVGSIIANCISLYIIYNSFKKIHYNRIFPAGYTYSLQRKEDIKIEDDARDTLIFVGDSRAEMWHNVKLKKKFNVINIAHGGQTSGQVALQLKNTSAVHGAWIILQVGINDIHPLGVFQNKEITNIAIDNCKKNIDNIVEHFIVSGNKVVVTTLFPPSPIPLLRKFFWPANANEFIQDINRFIKKMAIGKDGVYVIDSYRILSGSNNYLDGKYADPDFFLHVNFKGYNILNSSLNEILQEDGS